MTSKATRGTVDQIRVRLSNGEYMVASRRAAEAFNQATGRELHKRAMRSTDKRDLAAWEGALAGAVFGVLLAR